MEIKGGSFALPEELGGEVGNYSPNQMKTAIVQVLEKRPNNSCMRDHLPKLIFNYLGVRPKGIQRQDATRKLRKAMGILKLAMVIKGYQATNKRLRLTDHHDQSFQKHIKRMSKRKAPSSDPDQFSLYPPQETGPVDDLDLETIPGSNYHLPPLPKPLDDDGAADEAESILQKTESRSPMLEGDEDEHLFEVLTAPGGEVEMQPRPTDESGERLQRIGFQGLVSELDKLPGVTSRLRLGEIELLLDVDGSVVKISLVFDSERKGFSAIAFLPLVQRAAVPLLKLFGMQELKSSLTIGIRGLEEQFWIKEFIPWDSEWTIQSRIQEFLREVVEVAGETVRWK